MPYHVSDDAGRRVVGIAFRPGSLAMQLKPSWRVRLSQLASSAIVLAGVRGLLIALVCVEARRMVLPFIVIGLAMLVIAADDASFLGGQRPFDGGDDGIHYDGLSRIIVEKFQADDFYGALEGSEKIFYYGGSGLTLCPLEHVVRLAGACRNRKVAKPRICAGFFGSSFVGVRTSGEADRGTGRGRIARRQRACRYFAQAICSRGRLVHRLHACAAHGVAHRFLSDRAVECGRRRHSGLCRRPWPRVRSLAAPDWCGRACSTRPRALLRGDPPLLLPQLVTQRLAPSPISRFLSTRCRRFLIAKAGFPLVSPAKGVLLSKSRAAHGTLVSRNSSPSAGRAAAKYTKPRQGRQFAVGAMAPAHKAGRQA